MKLTFTFLLLLFFGNLAVWGQHTYPKNDFLNKVFVPVNKCDAVYKREFKKVDEQKHASTVYTLNNQKRMTGEYILADGQLLKDGSFVFYYVNGQIESMGQYHKDIKVGTWKRYLLDGTERPERYYSPKSAQFIREIMAGTLDSE